jgi:hypothetical protein
MNTQPNTPIYHDTLIAWHNQRLWWMLCAAASVIVSLSVTTCILTLRPHTQPWVIEVNSKGEPVGGVAPLEGSQMIADSTVRWAIGEYVQNAFRISPNFEEEKTLLSRAYAMSSQQASEALTSYYHADKYARNPLVVGTKLAAVMVLAGCAAAPPPQIVKVIEPAPKPAIVIPPDPLADLTPEVRQAIEAHQTPTLKSGITTLYAYDPNVEWTIYCQPLRATEIRLNPDEYTDKDSVVLGDSVRWAIKIGPQAVMVEPLGTTADPNMVSNLVIHTNHRSYHLIRSSLLSG